MSNIDALIFASYVPHQNGMKIINEMFDVFLEKFADADFYIGINSNPCKEYLNYLEDLKKKINLVYEITPKELEIKSDASAYQTALKLLHKSKKEYNLVWFGHTKGMINQREELRQIFLKDFFNKRSEITNLLEDSTAGTYSLYLTKHADTNEFKEVLSQYYKFAKPYFYTYFYLFTFYVLKGKYLHQFLNNCDEKFYTTNLIDNGADIYMFERDFPHIIWRQGGYPLYKEWSTRIVGRAHQETHYFQDVQKYYD